MSSAELIAVVPCERILDICLLLDSSGSIRDNNPPDDTYDNWNLLLQFAADLVDYFAIGREAMALKKFFMWCLKNCPSWSGFVRVAMTLKQWPCPNFDIVNLNYRTSWWSSIAFTFGLGWVGSHEGFARA